MNCLLVKAGLENYLHAMKVMTIEVPDDLPELDVRLLLSLKLFEEQRVSLGRAAQMCGLGVIGFMDELARRKIPVINLSAEERAHELSDV